MDPALRNRLDAVIALLVALLAVHLLSLDSPLVNPILVALVALAALVGIINYASTTS